MTKLAVLVMALVVSALATSSYAAGDATAGEAASAGCASCHGAKGEGIAPNPKIAGLPEADFIKAMNEYKDGTRAHPLMNALAANLSEKDIADMAAYYAMQ